MRHIDQSFHILNHRGLTPQANLHRIGGLQARLTAFALQRFKHGRLFAADVSARAAVHRNVQAKTAVQDVFAEQAILIGIGDRLDPAFDAQEKLAPNIDKGALRPNGIGSNDNTFNNLMRVAFNNRAVLEGAWFSFVRVHRKIANDVIAFWHETPLQPGGKTSAPTPAQARTFHEVNDFVGFHGQRLTHRLVAAMIKVGGDFF